MINSRSFPLIIPSAEAELFQRQPDGTDQLVQSSRPDQFLMETDCNLCGEILGFKEPAVISGTGHAHKSCKRRAQRGR